MQEEEYIYNSDNLKLTIEELTDKLFNLENSINAVGYDNKYMERLDMTEDHPEMVELINKKLALKSEHDKAIDAIITKELPIHNKFFIFSSIDNYKNNFEKLFLEYHKEYTGANRLDFYNNQIIFYQTSAVNGIINSVDRYHDLDLIRSNTKTKIGFHIDRKIEYLQELINNFDVKSPGSKTLKKDNLIPFKKLFKDNLYDKVITAIYDEGFIKNKTEPFILKRIETLEYKNKQVLVALFVVLEVEGYFKNKPKGVDRYIKILFNISIDKGYVSRLYNGFKADYNKKETKNYSYTSFIKSLF